MGGKPSAFGDSDSQIVNNCDEQSDASFKNFCLDIKQRLLRLRDIVMPVPGVERNDEASPKEIGVDIAMDADPESGLGTPIRSFREL